MSRLKAVLRDALTRSGQRLRKRVPVILQDEMSECGLASIAMVAGYHGKHLTLRQLRRDYSVARDGMSLFQVIKVSDELGFTCRPLKTLLDGLRQLRTPSILFWNQRHFVVLEAVNRTGLHIVDPAVGRRFYSWEEALPMFSGVALEMLPGLAFTLQAGPRLSASLGCVSLLRKNPWLLRYLIPMGLLSVVGYLGGIAAPKLFSLTIDEVVAKNDEDFLYLILYVFGAIFLFKTGAAWLRALLDARLRVALTQDLSTGVIARLLRLPLAYFERRAPGDILRRTQAADKVYLPFTSGWMDIGIDSLFGLVFLLLMALINIKLAGLSLALCLLFFVFRGLTLPVMERRHKASIEAETLRNVTLLGVLGAIESMKLHHYEATKLATWSNRQADTETARAGVQRMQAMNQVVHDGLSHGHSLLVSALGALAVLNGDNSVGDLFAFVLYKDMFMACAFKLVDGYMNLRLVKIELARLDDIVDEQPEAFESCVYSSSPLGLPEPIRSIRMQNARFCYSSFERPTFDQLDFTLEGPGAKIAILGPSGCGKSTFLKVLAGFYPLDEGRLRINGQAMRHFGLRRYRQGVAYVMAHGEVVDGSLVDNIVMDDELDGPWLQACIEQVGLLPCVLQLTNGFNTRLGAMGIQLSSGQRQRLLVARALYRRPQLLLLDEPTAHLDLAARDVVIETIRGLSVSCVVVTHDRAVAEACAVVLRMSEGRLVPLARTC
ncbi:peptidase domain-containing ABC transporter [Pseudomonas asplenii]|uniref:peptidase domain-containing ABC transporter n=1 Tax=Pseudomonas asplenii TaxID=53407 RepID=UPI00036A2D25|nr:peptidase domain-containing ABC transporter [Pseudomonas fuscovaginae]